MAEDLLKDVEEIEENLMSEGEDEDVELSVDLCICGVPSLDEIVQCINADCEVLWYHKQCVGLTFGTLPDSETAVDITKNWLCADCHGKQDKQHKQETTPDTAKAAAAAAQGKTRPKAKIVYPVLRLQKDDARQGSFQNLKDGISSIFKDELFSINTPFARSLKTLSHCLIKNDDSSKEFAVYAFDQLWDVIEILRGKSWTEDRKVKMWTAFHSLCCSSEMRSNWAAVLETVHLQREDDVVFLLQHLLEYLHDRMLTDVMKTDKPASLSTLKPQTMDKHEEQALRYAVGYVPFKLMKKFKKKMEQNESASKCIKVLQQWAEESGCGPKDDIISYTKDWLKSQDRGKLFKVNDSVYHFFRSLEYATRTVVKVGNVASIRKNNIVTLLTTSLKSNTNVIKCWNTIVGDSIDSAHSSVLLDETLTCFAKIRCNAFIQAYLIIRKETDYSVSRKAQKGLRKELSQSSQPSK